jgi:hypothetical protein
MKIQIFIHLFDGTIEKYSISNSISCKNLIKKIKNEYKIEGNIKLKLKSGSKLIKDDLTLLENKIKNNENLYLYTNIDGGFIDIITNLLTGIADIFKSVGSVLEDLFMVIKNIFALIPNIFRPDKLINDVIYGTTTGITSLISGILEKINSVGKSPDDINGSSKGGIFGIENTSKVICTKPSWINLLILVLCPPLALYIHIGKAGILGIGPWMYAIFMVLICSGMTYYMYYFPGFLFAALHVLC